jgi:DNA repair photolyase
VLPLITDSAESLERVARAAKAAGACHFGANVLFLMPSAQRVFFPFLARRFPEHLKRYEASYSAGAYLKGAYPDRIRGLVDQVRRRVGIPARALANSTMPDMPPSLLQAAVEDAPQMSLFC